jgi:hypothetical protein
MKEVVDILRKNKIVCKKLQKLNLNTRKRINAYLGINLKDEYCIVFKVFKKSRFLTKDYEELLQFLPNINFRYKKKILILHSLICSKVKEKMRDWKIIINEK